MGDETIVMSSGYNYIFDTLSNEPTGKSILYERACRVLDLAFLNWMRVLSSFCFIVEPMPSLSLTYFASCTCALLLLAYRAFGWTTCALRITSKFGVRSHSVDLEKNLELAVSHTKCPSIFCMQIISSLWSDDGIQSWRLPAGNLAVLTL